MPDILDCNKLKGPLELVDLYNSYLVAPTPPLLQDKATEFAFVPSLADMLEGGFR